MNEFVERWVNRTLRLLLRRQIKVNQRYVIDAWESFHGYNMVYPSQALSFQTYMIAAKPKWPGAKRRVRLVGFATFHELQAHVGIVPNREMPYLRFDDPSEECPFYMATIHMPARTTSPG